MTVFFEVAKGNVTEKKKKEIEFVWVCAPVCAH